MGGNARPAAPDLYLVPLPQDLPGFGSFISAWVYTGGPCFVVDPGPSATVPLLVSALNALGVKSLDFILLTHAHIDHAGGAGGLARAMGRPRVACHPKAMPHLADPSRLWEASKKTLGHMAEAYGPITPVDQELLTDPLSTELPGISAIPTPGHAPHHISYGRGPFLFAGEAAGVRLPLNGGGYVLRPATPPRFFFDVTLKSLRALGEVEHETLCYGHVGLTSHSARNRADHEEQLGRWLAIMEEVHRQTSDQRERVDAGLSRLLSEDPLLAGFSRFSPEEAGRERYFVKNSVRGFMGYLDERGRG
ncbi:MAG: MBL fold metallo-hydrolase [Deltaproteobacteria bacterium]|nr:MBL fold metallo-hydrolase [Deltaproteobacteria bacterium]